MPFSSNNADTGLNLQDTYLKRSNGSGASAEWRAAAGLSDAALASGAFKAKLPQANFSGPDIGCPFPLSCLGWAVAECVLECDSAWTQAVWTAV